MMVWVVGLLLTLMVCMSGFACANAEEPSLSHKQLFIDRVRDACPDLPWFTKEPFTSGAIVKPAHGSSVKTGVKLAQWSVEMCQDYLGVPCIDQPYHPGPWEVRIFKSHQWTPSVMFLAGVKEAEERSGIANFEWIPQLQQCIDSALPLTPFLSADIRTDGNNILLLEINGSAGMPYLWSTDEVSLPTEMFQWLYSRYKAGINTLSLDRMLKILLVLFQRQIVRGADPRNNQVF
jgi:hypothetical protein